MNWRELMDSDVELDAVDHKALEKFNEWVQMAEGNCTREDCIRKSYDPEMLNEFCFYPMKYWGRLIAWAEDFYDEYEPSYQFKMIRASYLLTKVDPSIIQFADHESMLNPEYEGPVFVKQVEEMEISPEGEKLIHRLNSMESVLQELNNFDAGWDFSEEDMAEMESLLGDMGSSLKF